ncbi:MAG: MAPEG family protein [Pseudomonadota bacterium]
MTVTPIYAALAALLFVYLSIRVIGARRGTKTALGDGGHQTLQRAIRTHGNFAEYVPLALILMALAELQDRSVYAIHFVGLCLLVGRLLHAYGVSQEPELFKLRVAGMILTFTALISGALINLGLSGLLTAVLP